MDQEETEASMLNTKNVVPPVPITKKRATTTKIPGQSSAKKGSSQRRPKAS